MWNGCHGLVRHAGYWSLTDDCSVFLAAASVSVTLSSYQHFPRMMISCGMILSCPPHQSVLIGVFGWVRMLHGGW